MAKTKFHFKDIDVVKALSELDVNGGARRDAGYDFPPQDMEGLTEVEVKVEQLISRHYQENIKEVPISQIESSLQESASLRQADGHDGQISTLKIDLVVALTHAREKVSIAFSRLKTEQEHLSYFKKNNNLVSNAHIKSSPHKIFSLCLVLAMLVIELSTNTAMLMGAISGGRNAAFGTASVIAAINVVSSFLVGRLVFPYLFHVNKIYKYIALTSISIYAFSILYINFAMGVFRSLSEKANKAFDSEAMQMVAQYAAWPFDDLSNNTIESNALIMIGLLFAIIAFVDGYFFDESYPKYGKITRHFNKIQAEFHREKDNAFKLLDSHQKTGNKQLTDFKNLREAANKQWANDVDSVQELFANYAEWSRSLERAGNNLMQQYRTTNKSFRNTPAPAYFSSPHDFAIEKDPSVRFASLSSAFLPDATKDELYKESSKIIIGEYNSAIATLNNVYNESITELSHYIKELK